MKIRHIGVLIGGLLALNIANAGILDIHGQALESGSVTAVYDLFTKANSHIDNQPTGFTPNFSTISTSSGVIYNGYLSTLPPGATLIGATLDYAGLFTLGDPTGTLTSLVPAFYTPTFTVNTSQYKVTISSNTATVSNLPATATAYDLWTAFQTDLLAGHAIDITWSERVTFNDHTTTYNNTCAICSETFNVTSSTSFTAAQVSNLLHLSFQDPTLPTTPVATPEPASVLLSGFGLMIGGVVMRRRRTGGDAR